VKNPRSRAKGRGSGEDAFQAQVIKDMHKIGYRCYHVHKQGSMRSDFGFPDLTCAPPPHRDDLPVIVMELKTGTYQLTDDQREWLARLDGRVIVAREVRPETFGDVMVALLGSEEEAA
jgi:hypothetical protein